MKKKSLIFLLAILIAVSGGIYWFLNQPSKPLLERYQLDGLNIKEVVAKLEASNEGENLKASIRPTELLLSDAKGEATISTENQFYLSVAPYIHYTHECFNHSITTCQGELSDQLFTVKIIGDDQRVYYDGEIKTGKNGFFSLWLPSNIKGTITIKQNGLTAESSFSTAVDQATCVTTMQLV